MVDFADDFRKLNETTRQRQDQIREKALNSLAAGASPVSPEVLCVFALRLSESDEHGEYYRHAMQRIALQMGDEKLKSGVADVANAIRNDGSKWSEACKLRPDVFSARFIQAIEAYETSGKPLSYHLNIFAKYNDL